jgi:predicted O-methyltransferase YrrM
MFGQITNIIKLIRPKHILSAIISPSHSIKAFKYHYRRVSERSFVEFWAKKWRCFSGDVYAAYQDYENNIALWEEIKEKLAIYPSGYGLQMTKELPALYLTVRLIQPDCIIETGVSAGASSTYILRALRDNKKGKLYSIDLPADNLPTGKASGWVVPQYLKSRWALHIGNSKDLLELLMNDLGEIDCFIHDSLHTYEHMIWEFRTAWKYLQPGGLFLSHDVGANDAFFDFMREKGISWKDYRVFHVLGGFQKPDMSTFL